MLKRMAVVVLGVCLVGLAGCPELQDLRKQNASLKLQVLGLQKDNQTLTADNQALKSDKASLQTDVSKATSDAKRASALMDELKGEQEKLRKQKEDLAAILQGLGPTIESRPEGNFIVTGNEILFDPGSIELKASASPVLDKVADYLQVHSEINIRVDGHTDGQPIKVSNWLDNYHLAAMRAHAVMKYLVDKGVKADRMFICGFGPNRPLRQPKAPEEAVAGNRRVEILLIPEAMRSIGQILEGFKS